HNLDSARYSRLFALLRRAGYRVREPGLKLPPQKSDYQAVVADEGFAAFLYLADRSACSRERTRCAWENPPPDREDMLPVLRALYAANHGGRPRGLEGTLDLIFARDYSPTGIDHLKPFEIFDEDRLVPIDKFLAEHPRPDLIEVARRMKWLGEGP